MTSNAQIPDDELEAKPEPDWKIYEKTIAHLEESYKNCRVTRNHKKVGRRSGIERQIDVWLEGDIGDNHTVSVAIECRRLGSPVSIKDVDAFVGFIEDVGANKGVMVSHSGFTEGATKRAEGAGIALKTLTIKQAEEFDWDEFLDDYECHAPECFGSV